LSSSPPSAHGLSSGLTSSPRWKTIASVHASDEGCLLYALHEGDDRLVMVEKWASAAALAEHGRGPAPAELTQALAGRTEGDIDVQVLQPHPAGTPNQGTL
jgi:quinol monooxygenase YgiN